MKKLAVIITLLIASQFIMAGNVISAQKLNVRKKIAVEIISSDEGFLEEYSEKLTENELTYFYKLAFKMAEEVAENTAGIEDDDEAYQVILAGIESRSGVKNQVKTKIEKYLAGGYKMKEVEITPDELVRAGRILDSVRKVQLMRKLTGA